MAEETNEKNNQEMVPKADLDALRSTLEAKAAAARKEASEVKNRLREVETRIIPSDYEIKLEPDEDGEIKIDGSTKEKIGQLTKQAIEAKQNLASAVGYAMDASAKALSWEVAVEVKAVEEQEDIYEKLKAAETPREMEIMAKEIRLEYKSKKPNTTSNEETGEGTPNSRQFATGQGKGTINVNQARLKAIEEIDINDPEAQKKLDALYA